jgi:hypothetical protein
MESPPRLVALNALNRSKSDHTELESLLNQSSSPSTRMDPLHHRTFAALQVSPLKLGLDVENQSKRSPGKVTARPPGLKTGHGRTWSLGAPLQNIIVNQLPEIAKIHRKDSGPCPPLD